MKNQINKIGFGTAAIGRPQYINLRTDGQSKDFSLEDFRKEGMAMLDKAYQQGVRYFDTAPGYGMAEQLLIDWSREKNDPSIAIATKWGYTYVADFDQESEVHEVKEHSLTKLNQQWQQSKKLLPFLKVYQIHSATMETGVLDNVEILERLHEIKTKYKILIGISTTGINQVDVLVKALGIKVEGIELFDVFQVTYNIYDQSLANVAEEMHHRGKKIVVKEALANGRIFKNDAYPHYKSSYNLLKETAEKYQVGTDAIALRFCMDSLPAGIILSGASKEDHLMGNIKAVDLCLEANDIDAFKKMAVDPGAYWSERKRLAWN